MKKIISISSLKKDSKPMMARIQAELLSEKFLIGSHNSLKLKKSLGAVGRLDLVDKTLLCPVIHKKHSNRLAERFIAKWLKVKNKSLEKWQKLPLLIQKQIPKPTDHEISSKHFRFLTLVDSVCVVDSGLALKSAVKLKNRIKEVIEKSSGIGCLGCIEVEVISLSKMKEIKNKDSNSNSEARKLDVCELLASDLKGSLFEEESCLFLIHFHGLVTAKKEIQFDDFLKLMKRNKAWNKAPRQIELKKLSNTFAGKPKSIELNLKHLATYITKGGNDWVANKAYLRYKIGFENDYFDEESWVAQNWRRNELLRKEHSEDGIIDALSMSSGEIVELTLLLDGLMASNRTRTGYLLSSSF